MKKKAIIFDLDNTIYSVQSIGQTLFHSLFNLIKVDGSYENDMNRIEDDLMRRPFQIVAEEYMFSKDLKHQSTNLLKALSYNGPIVAYPDYHFTKTLKASKFLVTSGFKKLQQSKIDGLGIGSDFEEIFIVDLSESDITKKDVFAGIMKKYGYKPKEVLVVGDDLHSEIKAAKELNMDAVLYDMEDISLSTPNISRIQSFEDLKIFF